MKNCQSRSILVAVTLITLAATGTANAEAIFTAPPLVRAAANGEFSFISLLTAGDGCIGYTGYAYLGQENVEGGVWADTFCIDPQPVPPGTQTWFLVEGRLIDVSLPGTVWSHAAFCTGGSGEAVTTVLPAAVSAERDSWGAVKATYR